MADASKSLADYSYFVGPEAAWVTALAIELGTHASAEGRRRGTEVLLFGRDQSGTLVDGFPSGVSPGWGDGGSVRVT
jgi:hypothetical protein